ncbi:MAG: aminoacyl-tRNA hydrolase [Candidatus Niyogibacteria bacterium]|nr:aminoacyl-tRNA hydrolase [Candidatus Niyogibacteria bacterium]
MAHIIVGLGNPGKEYENTRHNTGRIFALFFAKYAEAENFVFNKKLNAETAEGAISKEKFLIALPNTYMNKSGSAIKPLVTSVKKAKDLIVIHDDLDIPSGRFKISFGKNSGGHKGVESIMRAIKTKDFTRIRVGISPKKKPSGEKNVEKLILGKFTPAETAELKKLAKKINAAIESLIARGFQITVSQL